ncbi:hypothetical protein EDD37DRAFT_269359 [Exophiala viscosa]|uniref:Uncharacterized protein n=1 Tax=Exophiala viscosa TaxID=2486360 RepID=A0AAN6E5L6_9EURO|nr:hypothetical protein EDD36DRAFT_33078 [Exophiala viscosa]KAI1627627.1 hypothetical protein EDD37DRAFT_269359 [Exophiala viscosa]
MVLFNILRWCEVDMVIFPAVPEMAQRYGLNASFHGRSTAGERDAQVLTQKSGLDAHGDLAEILAAQFAGRWVAPKGSLAEVSIDQASACFVWDGPISIPSARRQQTKVLGRELKLRPPVSVDLRARLPTVEGKAGSSLGTGVQCFKSESWPRCQSQQSVAQCDLFTFHEQNLNLRIRNHRFVARRAYGRVCEKVPGIHPRNHFCSQCLFLVWPTSGNFTAFSTLIVFNQSVGLDFVLNLAKPR